MINAQKLHQEFIRLGGMRHKLKNRMLAILPEIYESGIWKKYAGSIVEYAGKYGDIAGTTVIKRLRLERNLEDKPCLKAAIEKVGVHKVAMVAKIATVETEKSFAEKISNMSRTAVQSLAKELRVKNGFGTSETRVPQACHSVAITKKIELDEESTFLFMKLKSKLGKYLSDQEFLKLMLKDRERQEFSKEMASWPTKNTKATRERKASTGKQNIAEPQHPLEFCREQNITDDAFDRDIKKSAEVRLGKDIGARGYEGSAPSRHIPADKKRQAIAQTNGKCSYPNCNSPHEVLHHIDRFSASKSHNSIIPLCKIHHEFSHNNLIQNENQLLKKWQLSIVGPPANQIPPADILYQRYWQKLHLI
ncbi:MAG: hypothetical protein PHP74_03495 [Candidatus Gracilibacteria bacterium]|nr:hypothetical protein [Candidatus Gracilibacteria bacterium]